MVGGGGRRDGVVGVSEEHLQAGYAAVPGGLLGDMLEAQCEFSCWCGFVFPQSPFLLLFFLLLFQLLKAKEKGSERGFQLSGSPR